MNLHIIQWNISYSSKVDSIINLLKEFPRREASIFCFQEVIASNVGALIDNLQPTSYSYSLDHRPPGPYDGKNRKLGLLTLTFGLSILESSLVSRCLLPERTLLTKVKFNSNVYTILNFHSLTGVGYKHGKGSQFSAIAEYLSENRIDIFCCDANEPKVDAKDHEQSQFWDLNSKYSSLIFSSNPVHDLKDVVRTLEIKPLPTTHQTGKTFRRYDHVYHSSNFQPLSAKFYYDEALKASSDHALVYAKFLLSN